ncbi:MAG: biotin--[acetyl-CoA-carboxylase] ligase [Thermodesulfobacteriota bacterium]|nr:biotin--[acetyl-CoA-carboxylase] ligase [Thermodesulfobacteriota bacterium]
MQTEVIPSENKGLDLSTLRKGLGQSFFAANIVFHKLTDSTNNLAKKLAAKGAPEGTVVLAEMQTAGRGRMERRWLSPGYVNLLFSLLLRPPMKAEQVFGLTMLFALASIDGVKEESGLESRIKWPNDLYIGRKKLGGILTELSVRSNDVEYVVLGLGLNVNWNPAGEGVILYPSTSILAETGRVVSRERLLIRVLKMFESYYRQALRGGTDEFYEKWNERSMLLGKRVKIKAAGGNMCGNASRVDRSGALIIVDDSGQEQKVVCGDVSVLGIQDG